MVPTQRTSLFRPFLKAFEIEIVSTEDGNCLFIALFKADGTNKFVEGGLLHFR